ncbi:hypothetical protein CDEF62S_00762 [Castellaniella defragrans]
MLSSFRTRLVRRLVGAVFGVPAFLVLASAATIHAADSRQDQTLAGVPSGAALTKVKPGE